MVSIKWRQFIIQNILLNHKTYGFILHGPHSFSSYFYNLFIYFRNSLFRQATLPRSLVRVLKRFWNLSNRLVNKSKVIDIYICTIILNIIFSRLFESKIQCDVMKCQILNRFSITYIKDITKIFHFITQCLIRLFSEWQIYDLWRKFFLIVFLTTWSVLTYLTRHYIKEDCVTIPLKVLSS